MDLNSLYQNDMKEKLINRSSVPIPRTHQQQYNRFSHRSGNSRATVSRSARTGQSSLFGADKSEMLLENIGYKQELYRGFNSFMSFSFCFSSIAVISSLSLVINYGLETGGPAVMVWGWIISCLFTLIVGLSLSEICSVYPVAGSVSILDIQKRVVYYWAGALSSDSWAPVNSYVCGWLYLIGNIACDSSFAFGFSQMLTAIIQMGSEGRIIISQGVQVFIAILINHQ